jgi:hypothetical protein
MPDSFLLRDWQNFYMLAGTASATLIGLMFVAISFGARLVPTQTESSVRAFVTPTVIHFGIVLILSSFTLMPAYSNVWLAIMLGAVGGVGTLYCLGILRQMMQLHRVKEEGLHPTHWTWNLILPMAAYLLILGVGLGLLLNLSWLLNGLALAVICLIIVGLHNAFDLMMWIARQV